MKKYLFIFMVLIAVGAAVFCWVVNTAEKSGTLSAELKQANKEIAEKDIKYEVRRKEEKKREKIYISPNRQRDDVLNLMRAGLY